MYLVDLLTNINMQDSDGWTPLMYAARSKCLTIVKYLLQRRANPNIQQVRLLLNVSHVSVYMYPPQSNGFTALHLAAQENHVKICELLLKHGCNPNVLAGPQQLTPLHMAAHKYVLYSVYSIIIVCDLFVLVLLLSIVVFV